MCVAKKSVSLCMRSARRAVPDESLVHGQSELLCEPLATVKVHFRPAPFNMHSLGYRMASLNRSQILCVSVQIEPGMNVELPLWLCKALVTKELVTVKRPTFLGERYACCSRAFH
jgi:hypothetical protein